MTSLIYRGQEYKKSTLSKAHRLELEKKQGVPMTYRNKSYYRPGKKAIEDSELAV